MAFIGIDRIEGDAAVEELLDGDAEARFDGHAELGIGGDLLAPQPPPCGGVLDAEVGDDLTFAIDDDDVMMIFGPVEAGVVGEFLVLLHGGA